ncbi:MAG TPA: DUF1320 family protein [Phycisphaerae bacterium]|nr:DUF1320 family protein [Phycisphaerae bacterium]HRY69050.1 DUF1320 family protein [Phycisphaerae bacterium]HSA25975.1 DUF1320 family protein [Phycisphaerae bacterium]
MSYATDNEAIERIGSTTLMRVQGETVSVSTAKLKASRAHSAALMDSYLAGRIIVPVDTVYWAHLAGRLRDVELDLVRYLEFAREDVANVPELVKDQRDAAIQWLEAVRDGRASLTGSGQIGSVTIVRGNLGADNVRPANAEFNVVTRGATGTYAAELGDSGLTNLVVGLPGWLVGFGYRQIDALSGLNTVAMVPAINGTALTDSAATLTWDASHETASERFMLISNGPVLYGGFDFEAGDLLTVKFTEGGSCAASKAAKAFLNLQFYTGLIEDVRLVR